MVNAKQKESLFMAFVDAIKENVKENLGSLDMPALCASGDVETVKRAVEKIRSNVTSAIPQGYAIPKASLYTSCSGTEDNDKKISMISVSLTNGWKDEKKFKFSIKVFADKYAVSNLVEFFQSGYSELFEDILVCENLDAVNAVIGECAQAAGLPYEVKVVSPLYMNGKKLRYISDDSVEFVVDINKIFDIEDIMALQVPDEMIKEEQIAAAKQNVTDELGLYQTTPQLVGAHGGKLIKYLCNIGTQVKAMTLIRKVNNKNVERLTGAKDTTAYYEKDGVYAVVARRDGAFEVLLKPFDMETLVNADVDVLKAIK